MKFYYSSRNLTFSTHCSIFFFFKLPLINCYMINEKLFKFTQQNVHINTSYVKVGEES